MNNKFKLKKGDEVIVLAGKDKGKTGKITKIIPKKMQAIVSEINKVKKMNTKKMSKIRNKAKAILVEWLKTLLNEEEQKKVNVKNVLTLLPNQTHYWQNTTLKLQPWSYKWVVKKLKKDSELTYDDLNNMLQPTEKQIRRQKMIRIPCHFLSSYG